MTGSAAKRTAFITGASQGIGAAMAEAFARAGYDVAVSSTQPEKLEGLLARIKAAGGRAVPVALDVRSQSSIEQAMAAAVAGLGQLDVLVNNAAVPLRKRVLDVSPAEWDAVIDTGLKGTFFMCQQMGRHLVAAKRPGCIISIGSTHGLVAARERSVYGIAKAAVCHMTRMLAYEWAEHGIRVNAVAPGTVETRTRAEYFKANPAARQAMVERVPLHRFGEPEEIAAAVRYLASPEAAYVTGQTLLLDGGLTSY